MVCHETYKDENNNWLTPDEVEKIDNEFVKKITTRKKLKWAHQINVKIKKKCDRS